MARAFKALVFWNKGISNWYLDNMDLEIIRDCDKEFIDNLYDKKLKKYVKEAKFMLSKKRLILAYEGFYNEDKTKALKNYEELKELARKSPSKG